MYLTTYLYYISYYMPLLQVGGLNGGRSFVLRAKTEEDGVMWFHDIVKQVKLAKLACC